MVIANNAYARLPKIHLQPETPARQATKARPGKRPLAGRLVRRVVAGILVVALALVVVYRYSLISEVNMGIREQTRTRDSLLDEQRHLKITISELSSLGRIEKVAIEELGMRYPSTKQVKYVGANNPESRDGDGG